MSARMPRTTSPLLLFLALAVTAQAKTQAPPATEPLQPIRPAAQVQQDFVAIARDVFPSLVTVRAFVRTSTAPKDIKEATAPGWVSARAEDYPGFQFLAGGSGFFVDAEGEVLTCLHPLLRKDGALADLVEVETQDGSRIISEVTGTEPTLDLAIVHCMVFPNWQKPEMKPLRFGDSDAMECGQWALAFGDPPGPGRYLAAGLLAAKPSRDCYQELLSSAYMQASLRLHPQAFGGPLVAIDGSVVGILCRLAAETGDSSVKADPDTAYALPSKIAENLYQSIRKARSFQSPWFGFSVMSRAEVAASKGFEAFQAMARPKSGIMIESIFKPSPAADAGIEAGDFLTALDGVQVAAPVDFQRLMYLAGAGKQVKLELFRKGETFTRELTIAHRPPEAKPR